MSIAEVRIICREMDKCQKRLDRAIVDTYPLGRKIRYEWGAGRHLIGQVIHHGYGGRIKFRNLLTGKERWVAGDSLYLSPLEPQKAVRK